MLRGLLGAGPLLLSVACADVLSVEQKEPVTETASATPPPRWTGPPGGVPRKLAFAARKFAFGARDPETGVADPTAWSRIGFDFDGIGTPDGTRVKSCRAPSGNYDVLVDGEQQRDNNFGGQLLTEFAAYTNGPTSAEDGANESISLGFPTLLLVLDHVDEGPNDPELYVSLYVSKSRGAPSWDSYDRFPIDDRTVEPGSLAARMRFADAYMRDHTIVSGDFGAPNSIPFLFPLDPSLGMVEAMPRAFTVTVELDEQHETVVSSTLSLVLRVEDAVSILDYYASRFGLVPCHSAPILDPLVREFADLRADGERFNDASGVAECDAISVAFEIEWFPIRHPTASDVESASSNEPHCGD